MFVNLISSIAVFLVSVGINFLLTPYIIKNLGNEAYGFVGLSNSIVSYASIFTVAINSMCGRFVAFNWHRQDRLLANKFYSTALSVNFIFSIFIIFISTIFVLNLDSFLNVEKSLRYDVALTIFLYFINFCIVCFGAIFSIAMFVENKLYLMSVRNAISSFIMAFLVLMLFYFLTPHIFYLALSALISSSFVLVSTFLLSFKVAPDLKFKFAYFRLELLKKLFCSGVFNSFNALNRVLMNGFDLYMANIFLGANATGILAISKSLPLMFESFVAQLGFVFSPKVIKLYSKDDIEKLCDYLKFCMNIVCFIITIPIALFFVFGENFYLLWLSFKTKGQIEEIYLLSVIIILPIFLMGLEFVLFCLDSATNKLKRPAIVNFIIGCLIVVFEIYILKYTNYGLLGLSIVCCVLYILRIFVFDIVNAAINLSLRPTFFYGIYIKNLIFSVVIFCIFFALKNFIVIKNWFDFFYICFCFGLFGYVVMFFVIFSKEQKHLLLKILKDRFKR